MNIQFIYGTVLELLGGVPLTLQLAVTAIGIGLFLATLLALFRFSGNLVLDWFARTYIFVFRGTPLLVQLFLIYYGLSQFDAIRSGIIWPILREPYWCAILALTLNTAAYSGSILHGGMLAVPFGQIEAARACGMPRYKIFQRILIPLSVRQALPAYGNEMISMVKATSLASIITLMEVTGTAGRIISESYRAVEVFIAAGIIYLAINFLLTRGVHLLEYYLSPRLPAVRAVSSCAMKGKP